MKRNKYDQFELRYNQGDKIPSCPFCKKDSVVELLLMKTKKLIKIYRIECKSCLSTGLGMKKIKKRAQRKPTGSIVNPRIKKSLAPVLPSKGSPTKDVVEAIFRLVLNDGLSGPIVNVIKRATDLYGRQITGHDLLAFVLYEKAILGGDVNAAKVLLERTEGRVPNANLNVKVTQKDFFQRLADKEVKKDIVEHES